MGFTELSPSQRYREDTQKKKNSLFTKGALYWAPKVPGAPAQGNENPNPENYTFALPSDFENPENRRFALPVDLT